MPPEVDAELDAGTGEPAGGEGKPDPKKDKQGDDEVVPKRQFLAALSSAEQKRERELAALRAEFEDKLAKATTKKADPPKRYSRGELNAAVTAGQITQEAADQVWDDQIRAEARAEAATVSTEIVTRAQRKERVDTDISRYTRLEPEILVPGSEIRAKVEAEYKFLVSLGDPANVETELKAIRAALGPIDQLELSRSGRTQHETHRETGGAGEGGKPRGKKFEDTLSPREKVHYQKGIDSGRYKGWDEVKAELQHANPNTRRKHGATV